MDRFCQECGVIGVWIVICFSAFVGTVFTHALVCRLFETSNRVFLFILVGAAGLTVLAIESGFVWNLSVSQFFAASIFYAALCELYIFLFTMALSSVSVSLLIAIEAGPVDVSRIDHEYDSEQMIRMRLHRLETTGLVEVCDEELSLAPRGARLVLFLSLLREFFRH